MTQPRSKRRMSRAQAVLDAPPRYIAPEGHSAQDAPEAKELRRREVLEQATYLTVDEVAFLLRASVDTVRRIPRSDLVACVGPGKPLIYLREAVIAFLKRSPATRRRKLQGGDGPVKGEDDHANVVPFNLDGAIERIRDDGTA